MLTVNDGHGDLVHRSKAVEVTEEEGSDEGKDEEVEKGLFIPEDLLDLTIAEGTEFIHRGTSRVGFG